MLCDNQRRNSRIGQGDRGGHVISARAGEPLDLFSYQKRNFGEVAVRGTPTPKGGKQRVLSELVVTIHVPPERWDSGDHPDRRGEDAEGDDGVRKAIDRGRAAP